MRARTEGMLVAMMPAPAGRCPEHLPFLTVFQGEGNATRMGKIQVGGSEVYATGGTGRFGRSELVETVWSGGLNLTTYESWSVMDGGIRLH